MPEGMEARPSRIVGMNKAVLCETWPDVVLHKLAPAYWALPPQFVRGKHRITLSGIRSLAVPLLQEFRVRSPNKTGSRDSAVLPFSILPYTHPLRIMKDFIGHI